MVQLQIKSWNKEVQNVIKAKKIYNEKCRNEKAIERHKQANKQAKKAVKEACYYINI